MRRTVIDAAFHFAQEPTVRFEPNASRWGHGGVHATIEPAEEAQYVFKFPGPYTVLEIEDEECGSYHLLQGYGSDLEWNELVAELAPVAGLGTEGPPWLCPRDVYGIDHYRELHRLLRIRLESEGYDGWWLGGELVLWKYELLNKAMPLSNGRV